MAGQLFFMLFKIDYAVWIKSDELGINIHKKSALYFFLFLLFSAPSLFTHLVLTFKLTKCYDTCGNFPMYIRTLN